MQFYVNLLDNPRLDHEFSVFGEITAGMAAIDRVLEGDVIARIDVLAPPSPSR
jgi:cyclophilin family peptidyl-prolyl cis-trans isomerase